MNGPVMQPAEAVLPILAHRDEIAAAIRDNPVVVVCGETGSGKTTQIPQICLAEGRGARGRLIACTQPRRIAALSVAERVAQELGPDRNLVGWQHRFAKRLSRENRIKFMTDGILLSELRSDPLLRAYDTIMVDEAHERTLNVDFILGCLKRILPHRPDLRVIVSSATLETKAFSAFFDGAPVLSIPGRTFPVEVRWRPPEGDDPDLPSAVADAVEECLAGPYPGDVLVFLSGERDIRAAAEALRGRGLPHTEVLPLLASLPPGEQRRAFVTIPGVTRIVLATNVAETSVTIPGIRYVVDSGLARVARYNPRIRVKRLHVEPVSRASADQRKGRCGRIGPGVCIRLYDAEDYDRRPAQTDPEIRRTSLAGTILSMLDWRLGDVEDFPFLQPPSSAAVREARKELLALGAVSFKGSQVAGSQVAGSQGPSTALRLTPLGRRLAKLPLEPSLGRMLYEADEQASLRDALTVVSALACEDPYVRPPEQTEQVRQAHAQFRDKGSDFDGLLLLWRHYHDPAHPLSRSAMRRDCQKNFVSYRRMCEWEDVRDQLEAALRREGLRTDSSGGGDPGLHRALLSGLLANIGVWDPEERNYKGANGTRFWLFPGSGLAKAKTPPDWVMAAELVDTSRLFARRAAAIDPDWIEPLARAVCRYSYSGESWDERTGTARALRRTVLYGLTVQDGVRCDISRVNPALCREIFIREGLVGGAFPKPVPEIVRRNLATIAERTDAARKTRSLSLDTEIDAFCALYDERLPRECVNVPSFRDWLLRAPPNEVEKLLFVRRDFSAPAARAEGFPAFIELFVQARQPANLPTSKPANLRTRLPLSYKHELGAEDDGITCTVRPEDLPLLPLFDATRLVPGALPGMVAYLLRTLPRGPLGLLAARCDENPRAPDADVLARAVLERLPPEGPLPETLVETLARDFGVRLPRDVWPVGDVPPQFRLHWRVATGRGRAHFASRDPDELLAFLEEYRRLAPGVIPARTDFLFADGFRERDGLRRLSDCPDLPDSVPLGRIGTRALLAHPALCEGGAIRLFPTRAAALAAHRVGTAWLAAAAFSLNPPPNASPLAAAAARRALRETFGSGDPPRSGAALEAWARPRIAAFRTLARDLRALAEGVEALRDECLDAIDALPGLDPEIARDAAEQLGWLCPPGYVEATPSVRLAEFPRYLDALLRRLRAAVFAPAADRRRARPLRDAWRRYAGLVTARDSSPPFDEEAAERYRWLLEECRVSVFAQALGTSEPASLQRLDRLWAQVVGQTDAACPARPSRPARPG